MRSDIHQKNNTTPPADTVPESISLSSDFLSSCENTRVELIKNSNKAKNGTSYAHGHIGRQDATFTSKQESKDQNEMFSAAAEQRCFSLFAFRNLPFLPSFFFVFLTSYLSFVPPFSHLHRFCLFSHYLPLLAFFLLLFLTNYTVFARTGPMQMNPFLLLDSIYTNCMVCCPFVLHTLICFVIYS